MIVGSTKENSKEKRIAITPETSKNIINLGLNISLQEDYGVHLGYSNESYKNVGVKILTTSSEVLSKSDLLCKVNCPSLEEVSSIKENSKIIIGSYDPVQDKDIIKIFSKKKLMLFHLTYYPELLELNRWTYCLPKQILLAIGRLLNQFMNMKKRFL